MFLFRLFLILSKIFKKSSMFASKDENISKSKEVWKFFKYSKMMILAELPF